MQGNETDFMLGILGFGMIVVFMVLIMTRVLSAIVALIVVPIIFGLLAGHDTDMVMMAIGGFSTLAPTAVTLLFAVLYFSLMLDAGLFDPLVSRAIKFAQGDPLKVMLASTTVATLVSFDGDGATTAIVTIGAFLPIYRRLGMNPLYLAVVLGLSNAVVNLAPWGGPALRAATALQVDITEVFVPLIPVMIVGIIGTFVIAWYLGLSERKRIGISDIQVEAMTDVFEREEGVERPKLIWLNLILTLAILGFAIAQIIPLPIAFMIGFSVAMVINYPCVAEQRRRISAHAENALPIVLLIFAAAVFVGILDGTKMVDAMGQALLAIIPDSVGPYFGAIIALTSAPLTFVMSNDAYYFGIVPVLAEAAGAYGVTPLEVARASLLGVTVHALSPLIAAIYLVAGLLDVEVGDLQRVALPFAVIIFFMMMLTAFLSGAVPFVV